MKWTICLLLFLFRNYSHAGLLKTRTCRLMKISGSKKITALKFTQSAKGMRCIIAGRVIVL